MLPQNTSFTHSLVLADGEEPLRDDRHSPAAVPPAARSHIPANTSVRVRIRAVAFTPTLAPDAGHPDTCSLLADPTVTRCPRPPGRRLVTGARSSVSPGRQASWLCMLGASGERRHLGGGLGRTTCGSRERPDPGPCRRHRQRIRPYAGRPQRGASTHHPLAHVPGPALRRPETAVRRPHAHPSTAHPSSASTSSLASASPGRSKTSPRRALRKRRYPPSVGEECTSM